MPSPAKFCQECGTAVPASGSAKFCSQCGTALAAAPEPVASTAATTPDAGKRLEADAAAGAYDEEEDDETAAAKAKADASAPAMRQRAAPSAAPSATVAVPATKPAGKGSDAGVAKRLAASGAAAASPAAAGSSGGGASAEGEDEDDGYDPNISILRSAFSARHPVYRDARMLVLRAALIFALFVLMHYTLFDLILLPRRKAADREAFRNSVRQQMCPPGVECEYTLPDVLPFEDRFS